MPINHREIHVLNVNKAVKFIFDLGVSQMTEVKKKIKFHSKSDDIQNIIEPSLLPLEYGGEMPMADMIESFKKELEETRDLLLTYDLLFETAEYRAGYSRKSGELPSNRSDSLGLGGSFKKLEID